MQTLSTRQQFIIGGVLLLAMVATRGNIINHLQDASWAIFFLAGFYLRNYLSFPVFMAAAFVIDLSVINLTGVDNYCFTPAYMFTIPAYALLWLAGRWFSGAYQQHGAQLRTLAPLAIAATIGVVVSFFISNAGFYAFSNHFETMSMVEYASSVAKYLPMYLQTTLFYLATATLLHVAVLQTTTRNNQNSPV